ncbi:MAG: hypothetical protein PUC66_03720 [Erysipelotrichaceae bacterium]|nr:hypothetical protein [Erysipelotrichaceae bacterium]
MGIVSLVLGLLSIILACVSFNILVGYLSIVALVLGICGIVFGGITLSKKLNFHGCGVTGLVLGIISTVFSFIPAIIWIIAIVAASAA